MIVLKNKEDLLNKIRSYAETPDDDVIRFKEEIKENLLSCVELLYAIHDTSLETELFNSDGTLNIVMKEDSEGNLIPCLDEKGHIIPEGEWDLYFGYRIRPALFIPETQSESGNFLCYTVSFTEMPRYNEIMYYPTVTFTALVDKKDAIDENTKIARHDLIGAIIREKFNWSNIFGSQFKLVSNKEYITDTDYITRTLVFQSTKPNTILFTNPEDNKSKVINNIVRS